MIETAGETIPELMTEIAVRLQPVDPVVLRQHRLAEAVAVSASAGKIAFRRRLQQRQPVVARIHLCGFLRRLRGIRAERHRLALRLHRHRRRIDQAIAADPHAVVRVGQLRQGEAAAIVGDDNLDDVGRQVTGFGDDPHAGLWSLAALDHAGDVVGDRGRLRLRPRRCAARLGRRDPGNQQRGRHGAYGRGAAGAGNQPCGPLHTDLLVASALTITPAREYR